MKKFDFTRILFLITSLIILIIGITIPKSKFTAVIVGILTIVALVVFDMQAPKIAKLSEDNPKIRTMRLINRVNMSIVIILSLFFTLKPSESFFSAKTNEIIISGLVAIFMMFFGNLSPKIPFNRYLGLRLPWTIRDEDTWKIAHKILGYLSFPLAIIMFILSFYFDVKSAMGKCIFIWILIPGLYSLVFYYKKMKA